MELTEQERENINRNMKHNRAYRDNNPSKDVNPSKDEWDAVLVAAVTFVQEHNTQTIRSKNIMDAVPLGQSIIGSVLKQQADATDVIEETPFKPNGGRRFRVHPAKVSEDIAEQLETAEY
jgi:hypothetical protein